MACQHERVEPVVASDELVALLCASCLESLPTNWGCTDCEWAEIHVLCEATPQRVPGQRCRQHA